ncbi:MAG: PilN domain-containing protein [Candidatus Brocadiaceae bacterium]|nr:PilN domain-containing protein [Candidatus Brocadiaceae bacterium]
MFFPKSIGLSIHCNDLIVTKAYQIFLNSSFESTVVEDFLLKESLDLKLLIDTQGIQKGNIILSWPREKTIVREIELPGSSINELRESISYQLDSFVMFTEEEIYYDIYQSNSSDYGEKVFIFAIKRDELDNVISKLESSNLKPDRVIVSPLSYVPLINDDNKVAVIEKCMERYTFSLYVQSTLVSTSLVRNKDILKDRLNAEMPNDLAFFGLEQDEVSDIYNTDNFNVVFWSEKKQSLGVSLNGLSDCLGRFNVLKTKVKSKVSELVLMGVLAMLVLAFIAILPGIFKYKREMSLQAINLKLKELRPGVMESNRLRDKMNGVLDVTDKINEVIDQKLRRIDLIAELTNAIPDDTWLKQLYIKDNSFEIEGVGLSGSKVLTLLEYSPKFEQVSFTSSVVKNKEGKERFKIKGSIK